ncbi:MSHA biogenesis protein MshJ [Marinobacter sp. F4218]|uniref:MSHA biogenesis protein MshJ n=1 Tax=Marinobacter sp. F4218 TaxID=2862868 RepID=UPI001C62AC5A|nr:MSHA biogenesis protein MshJ [Marinobacter sp. F4218]MBW7472990.1 MSHA biogenesis protein MshJ [Marinobacter sp. F4218]
MAKPWSESLQNGAQWFNDRPIRERFLITVTMLTLLAFIGWELGVAPAIKKQEILESRLSVLASSRDSLQIQQQSLTDQLAADPSQELRDQLESRRERLARLDRQIAETTGQLIAPRAMVSVLKDMLTAQESLGLQALDLKTPAPVFAPEGDSPTDPTADREQGSPLLYAHDVELTVQGSYLEVLAYLERLEALDERLGWVILEYDSESWPAGKAIIRVRTLSLESAWLGV